MAVDIYVKLGRILFRQESFGIGRSTRDNVMRSLGLKKLNNLSRKSAGRVVEFFKKNIDHGAEFAEKRSLERSYLLNSECYRAFRQLNNLPCHGQRTQTNAGTCKRFRAGRRNRQYGGGDKKSGGKKILTLRSSIRQRNAKRMERKGVQKFREGYRKIYSKPLKRVSFCVSFGDTFRNDLARVVRREKLIQKELDEIREERERNRDAGEINQK